MSKPRTPPAPPPSRPLPPLAPGALAWLLARLQPADAAEALLQDSHRRLGGEPCRVLAGRGLQLRLSALHRPRDGGPYYHAELWQLPASCACGGTRLGRAVVEWRATARLCGCAHSLGIDVVRKARTGEER